MRRPLLLAAGFIMLTFGFAGTLLPLLPATPFFLAAAWLFSRSSPRLERWLYGLPLVGSGIRVWRQYGAIRGRTKVLAVSAILVCALLIGQVRTLPAFMTWPTLVIMLAVAIYLVTRPGPPTGQ